ncbi:MAG: response regulator [Caldisericales bacterium]|nr:response regulator [Caldisericales bacterium]
MIDFYKAISAIDPSLEIEKFVAKTLEVACSTMGFMSGVVIPVDSEIGPVIHYNMPNDAMEIIRSWQNESRRDESFDFWDEPVIRKPMDKLARLYGIKGTVILPLSVSSLLLGDLVMFDTRRRTPTNDEKIMLEHVRTLLSITIANESRRYKTRFDQGIHEKLFKGVANATNRLVTKGSLKEALSQAINALGESTDIDMVNLSQFLKDGGSGKLVVSVLGQWVKTSDHFGKQEPRSFISITPPDFELLYGSLSDGKTVKGLVRELPDRERLFFEEKGITSFMIVPIFVDKEFWGGISFSDFVHERTWRKNDESILETMAATIGAFIENKRNEENLKKRESENLAILKAIPEMIFRLDHSGKLIDYKTDNERDLIMPADAKGKTLEEILPENVAKITRENLEKTILEGTTSIYQYHVESGGKTIYREARMVPYSGNQVLVLARDITEQKQFMEQLEEAKKMAEEANRAKSEFLANMSHEIRTPLNALLGFVELLENNANSPESAKYLAAITTAANAINTITADILDITKIEAGKLKLSLAPDNIMNVVGESVLLVKPKAELSKNSIEVEFGEGSEKMCLIDSPKLRQVLVNLLDNAAKFTKKGHITVKVAVKKETESKIDYEISVSDTGIGIPGEMREKIFQAFMQVDGSYSRRFGGAGLGLAITRGILDAMGGTISVTESNHNENGTTFLIGLPLSKTDNTTKQYIHKPIRAFVHIGSLQLKDLATNLLSKVGATVEESIWAEGPGLIITENPGGNKNTERWPEECNVLVIGEDTACLAGDESNRDDFIKSFFSCLSRLYPWNYEMASRIVEGKKILLVEDNRMNIALMEEISKTIHCEMVSTTSSLAAVNLALKNHFDICLMDIQMPDLSGLDATMQIRYNEEKEHRQRLPIIALTAFATEDDKKKCLDGGMDGYLSKPIKIVDLVTGMAQVILKTGLGPEKDALSALSEKLLIEKTRLKEMMAEYVATSLRNINEIKTELEKEDFKRSSRCAHEIKGMAYDEVLFKAVVDLESSLRVEDGQKSFENLAILEKELKNFSESLGLGTGPCQQ